MAGKFRSKPSLDTFGRPKSAEKPTATKRATEKENVSPSALGNEPQKRKSDEEGQEAPAKRPKTDAKTEKVRKSDILT